MLLGVSRSLLRNPAPSGSAYDALALDWAARVVANGGADPSAATKQAVSDFCAALRSANILSKMLAVCCLTPGGLVEALTPLIKTSGGAAYGTELVTNGGFTSNTSGWTAVNVNMSSVSGGQSGNCLQLTVIDDGNPTAYAYQQVATTAGVRYKFTAYGKIGAASNYRMTIGTTPGGTDLYDSGLCYDTGWTQKTAYFTATGSAAYISLWNPSSSANNYDTVSCQVAVLCNDPWTNFNFVSGDLTVNGLVGNGSTKYLATNFTTAPGATSMWPYTNGGHTIYVHTNAAASASEAESGYNSSLHGISFRVNHTDGGGCTYPQFNSNSSAVIPSPGTGYYSINRLGDNLKLFHARSDSSHAAKQDLTHAAADYTFVYYVDLFRMSTLYTTKRLSFGAVHAGLTESESQSFYNAIQALRTALGGGYV